LKRRNRYRELPPSDILPSVMKHLLLAIAAAVLLAVPVSAASASTIADDADVIMLAPQADAIPNDDDDRVEVQLAVLGAVILTVFVLGTGAYLLRRRLGLTAYTPPKDAGHH
jgi:hypothetical protein